MTQEALKLALEALYPIAHNTTDDPRGQAYKAITALEKALAQTQEPFEDLATELFVVAQISPADDGFSDTIERIELWLREHFSTPPQRTWVGLTPTDRVECLKAGHDQGWTGVMEATQAKLKEKNCL